MTLDPAIATAADYADALIVARRAKRTIILGLIVLLLIQMSIFSAVKWLGVRAKVHADEAPAATITPPTDVTAAATQAVGAPQSLSPVAGVSQGGLTQFMVVLSAVSLYLGMIGAILLPFLLLLIALVMLVGRLIGLGPVVKAFVASLFVLLLLFPWQTLLCVTQDNAQGFILPGVLYTWQEISAARITPAGTFEQVLYWARFFVWPIITMVLLLVVQQRSARALRMALGETKEMTSKSPKSPSEFG